MAKPGKAAQQQAPETTGAKPSGQPAPPETGGTDFRELRSKMTGKIDVNMAYILKRVEEAVKKIAEACKELGLFADNFTNPETKKFDMAGFLKEFEKKVKPLENPKKITINNAALKDTGKKNGEWAYAVCGISKVYDQILNDNKIDKNKVPDDFGSKCLMMQFHTQGNHFDFDVNILNALKNKRLKKNDLMFYQSDNTGDKIYCGVIIGFNSSKNEAILIVNGKTETVSLKRCVYGVYLETNTANPEVLKDSSATDQPAAQPAKK